MGQRKTINLILSCLLLKKISDGNQKDSTTPLHTKKEKIQQTRLIKREMYQRKIEFSSLVQKSSWWGVEEVNGGENTFNNKDKLKQKKESSWQVKRAWPCY